MQKYILILLSLLLIIFSITASAERVLVTGSPVLLEQRDGVYYYPEGVEETTTSPGYYYYTVNGTNKVCYETEQPTYSTVDAGVVTVNYTGGNRTLHCYTPDSAYFDVQE